jgi:hypothetical protein
MYLVHFCHDLLYSCGAVVAYDCLCGMLDFSSDYAGSPSNRVFHWTRSDNGEGFVKSNRDNAVDSLRVHV